VPCLVVLIAAIFPRIALALVWLFSNYLGSAYQTVLWPVLGFLFMPLTTLAYAWAINSHGNVSGFPFFVVLVAALVDLGAVGGGHRASKRYRKRS